MGLGSCARRGSTPVEPHGVVRLAPMEVLPVLAWGPAGGQPADPRLTFPRRRPRVSPVPYYSLGIDIGGTFTDIVIVDHDAGRQVSRKVLTTHEDPARAVAAGVAALLRDGRFATCTCPRIDHAPAPSP